MRSAQGHEVPLCLSRHVRRLGPLAVPGQAGLVLVGQGPEVVAELVPDDLPEVVTTGEGRHQPAGPRRAVRR